MTIEEANIIGLCTNVSGKTEIYNQQFAQIRLWVQSLEIEILEKDQPDFIYESINYNEYLEIRDDCLEWRDEVGSDSTQTFNTSYDDETQQESVAAPQSENIYSDDRNEMGIVEEQPVASAEIMEIRREMYNVFALYEERIRSLQDRVQELENQNAHDGMANDIEISFGQEQPDQKGLHDIRENEQEYSSTEFRNIFENSQESAANDKIVLSGKETSNLDLIINTSTNTCFGLPLDERSVISEIDLTHFRIKSQVKDIVFLSYDYLYNNFGFCIFSQGDIQVLDSKLKNTVEGYKNRLDFMLKTNEVFKLNIDKYRCNLKVDSKTFLSEPDIFKKIEVLYGRHNFTVNDLRKKYSLWQRPSISVINRFLDQMVIENKLKCQLVNAIKSYSLF